MRIVTNRNCTLFLAACWAGLAAGLLPASAQVNYIQQGNVLDANPQRGAGGFNRPRFGYDWSGANRVVTGNVVGGRYFRAFSPVQDANSLFLGSSAYGATPGLGSGLLGSNNVQRFGLPSDRLNSFQRDSVNSHQQPQYYNTLGNTGAYYSPTGTAANTGAIVQGYNQPGSSQLRDPRSVPYSTPRLSGVDPLAGSTGSRFGTPTQWVRTTTGQPVNRPVNQRLLGTPLFRGQFQMVDAAQIARDAQAAQSLGAGVRRLDGGPGELSRPLNAADPRVPTGYTGPRPTSLVQPPHSSDGAPVENVDQLIARATALEAGEPIPNANAAQPGAVEVPWEAGIRQRQPVAGPLSGATDLFGRMREMSSRWDPDAGTARPGPGSDSSVPGVAAPGAGESPAARPDLPMIPLRTFVGTEGSVVNNYLAQAEDALAKGRYYRAAQLYELAKAADANNPLPVLGRSMALLAAGDYVSSAGELFESIRLFDRLGMFTVDIRAFIPDITVLDSRRADLEARLEIREDYRLRFLLGYAEYCSGIEELGMADMKKAIDGAPFAQQPLRRFVDHIDRRRALQEPVTVPTQPASAHPSPAGP